MEKRNTNAQTEHSRKLRSETATKWNREKRSKGDIGHFQVSGKKENIDAIKQGLENALPKHSYAEQIAHLLKVADIK